MNKEKLIKENMGAITQIAQHWYAKRKDKTVEFEDLIQEGVLGVLIACEKFDSSKNTKFITYAWSWINKQIAACASPRIRAKDMLEFRDDLNNNRYHKIDVKYLLKRAILYNTIKTLPDKAWEIFYLYHFEHFTFSDIGKCLGYSSQGIKNIHDRYLRKLVKKGERL